MSKLVGPAHARLGQEGHQCNAPKGRTDTVREICQTSTASRASRKQRTSLKNTKLVGWRHREAIASRFEAIATRLKTGLNYTKPQSMRR